VLRDPATGRPHEMLAVSRDVSERKRVERMRQDLVAMLSHDLKNPLTAVLGFAEILRELPTGGRAARRVPRPHRSQRARGAQPGDQFFVDAFADRERERFNRGSSQSS